MIVDRNIVIALIGARLEDIQRLARDVPRRKAEWTRGGHRNASINDGGGRGNEIPMPISQTVTGRNDDGSPNRWSPIGPADEVDRAIRRIERTIDRSLNEAVRALTVAVEQLAWYQTATGLEAEPEIPCHNLRCNQLLEAGRTGGECSRCRKHRSRHGLAYPQVP
jgi:hypothetical protein